MAVGMSSFGPPRTRLRCTRVGATVLVHAQGVPEGPVLEFARWCAAEPGHTVVAMDVPPLTAPDVLEDVLDVLADCLGVLRLIPTRSGDASTVEYGSWLVERLGRPVVAHQGSVSTVPEGGLYVPPGEIGGPGWWHLAPGSPPTPHSRRFPRPRWDCSPLSEPRGLGQDATLEPLPSGAWIRCAADSSSSPAVAEFRGRLLNNVVPDPLLLKVVLGYPGSQPPPIAAVAEFWSSLPSTLQPDVRFAGFEWTEGGVAPFGQRLADALDAPVVMSNGVQLAEPSANGGYELRTVLRQGLMTWTPYVGDLGYLPARFTGGFPVDPVPVGHRVPIAGLPEREPGVYEYSDDAVVEVTQSGLWVRPHAMPPYGSEVRSQQADPEHAEVVFDASTPAIADRMRLLANELVDRLEPWVRDSVRMFAATVNGTTPVQVTAPSGGPRRAAVHPVPGPTAVPDAALAAVEPAHGGRPASQSTADSIVWTNLDAEPAMAFALSAVEAGDPPPSTAPPRGPRGAAEPAEEPIAYGSFQLVSSSADLLFAAPKASTPLAREVPVSGVSTVEATGAPSAEPPAPASVAPSPVSPAHGAAPAAARPVTGFAPASPAPARDRPRSATGTAPPALPRDRPAETPRPILPDFRVPARPAAVRRPASPATSTRHPAAKPQKPTVQAQPVPTAQCSAAPREGDLGRERDWVRRNLSKQYDATASSVARILSEYPGLRVGSSASDIDVLTDLVALRLYLSGKLAGLDAAVRAARNGPHVPLARCVTSGLRRLPSYRGPLRTSAALSEEQIRWYGSRALVTEWSFFPALASARVALPGSADILIWSMSARRTELLDASRPDQAVFPPGTSFKVLSVEGGSRPEIRLRELTSTEVEADGTVRSTPALDDFAVTTLEEAGKSWRQEDPVERLPAGRQDWFASPPGLLVHPARAGAASPAQKGGNA